MQGIVVHVIFEAVLIIAISDVRTIKQSVHCDDC